MTNAADSRKRGPRGPYVSGREAQRAILDAARDVFAEHGFRGGVLRDVADRAGVSAANIIHHFGSKERLLVALLEERDLGNSRELRATSDGFVAGLRDLVRRNAADRGMVHLFSTLAAEATASGHPAHRFFRERYAAVRRAATEGVETAREQGVLPPGPPADLVAADLLAVMDGLQTQWLLDPGFDMVAAFEAHLTTIGAAR
ncbi:TetR family transcriptional regulator [Actinoplanes philippinensis]|uniref:DNA-binding transcriptional regulator, AcrR family n=1 Tax=Actinoplanes philippinensis TaxID=35752 RepID=A0A1I2G6I1_9ACTN|nr:TetR/AcrR family transcriptional regulator [Actinoplanes philippinensis]GIE76656.1 TetR family transcriptional regulator [Actinoplanes philippinensis]SFF13132.1 DNA-binding transcriptional regulator, AcrR family [Actinoplanes philippinensis]